MDDRYFTAAEAAEALGVSISTLYVYVGRKGIRSQAVPGSKQRRYWRPDIERLRKQMIETIAAGPFREALVYIQVTRGSAPRTDRKQARFTKRAMSKTVDAEQRLPTDSALPIPEINNDFTVIVARQAEGR